jgi:hypothetical protein
MTSKQLISQVANDVNDPGFEFINKEEWIQFMNDTRREMGTQAKIFYTFADKTDLVEGESNYPLTDQDVIRLIRVEYYFSGIDLPLPMNEKAFHRVMNELYYPTGYSYEYTSQTTEFTDTNGAVVLTITSDILNNAETPRINWYATKRDNGLFTLYFPFKFADGDHLRIYYYSTEVDHNYFNDVEIIFDPFAEPLKEGMRFRALRRLTLRRILTQNEMWMLNKECDKSEMRYYNRHLPWLKRYMKALGTESEVLEMKPFNYP